MNPAKFHALQLQLTALLKESEELQKDENATAEQATALLDKIQATKADLAVWQALHEQERAAPAKATTAPSVTVRDRAEDDPRRGFRSHRDFLVAAMANAGMRDRAQVEDERLRPLAVVDKDDRAAGGEIAFMLPQAFTPGSLLAAAGSDEQGGYADRYGGFSVPTTTLPGLLQLGAESDPSAGRTQAVPMATPSV